MVDPISLRSFQKEQSRTRIREAARELFRRDGYAATTIDQIALAAGTRRSTLYTHFRDKEEILGEIGAAFGDGLIRVMGNLSSPTPGRAEIDNWVALVAAFVEREQVPAILLSTLGYAAEVPEPVRDLGASLLKTLSANVVAFNRASQAGAGKAHAWAMIVLRELCWACLAAADGPDAQHSQRHRLAAVGDLTEEFIRIHG